MWVVFLFENLCKQVLGEEILQILKKNVCLLVSLHTGPSAQASVAQPLCLQKRFSIKNWPKHDHHLINPKKRWGGKK